MKYYPHLLLGSVLGLFLLSNTSPRAENVPLTINPAIEIHFIALSGMSYDIEASTDLVNWTVVESSTVGQGVIQSRSYSTVDQPNRFFRVRDSSGTLVLTPANDLSAKTVGGNVFSGNQTFNAQVELTGQSDTDDNSAMTRGLVTSFGDARYDTLNNDALNTQRYVTEKLLTWGASYAPPINLLFMGDSLSSHLWPFANMPLMGSISNGYYLLSGTAPTNFVTEDWVTGQVINVPVGTIIQYHPSGQDKSFIGSKVCVGFIADASAGVGSFDLELQKLSDGTVGAWTKVGVTQSTYSASKVGIYYIVDVPSTSHAPAYKLRITNVVGKAVKLICWGIYSHNSGGVVPITGVANLTGRDVWSWNDCPDSIFNPIFTGLGADLVISRWADAAAEWRTATSSTVSSANGGNFIKQYLRMKAVKNKTDFIQVSGNSTYNVDDLTNTWPAYAQLQKFGATNNGSTSLNFTNFTALIGSTITGPGIPANTSITAVSGNTATLSAAATSTASGISFTVVKPYYTIGDWAKATNDTTGIVGRYVCTVAHTQSAATKPGQGANWTSYWTDYVYESAVLASSKAAVRDQASAQAEWAAKYNETFIDSYSVFGDYPDAFKNELIGDFVHPTSKGWMALNNTINRKVNIANSNLFGSVSSGGRFTLEQREDNILYSNRSFMVDTVGEGQIGVFDSAAGNDRTRFTSLSQSNGISTWSVNKSAAINIVAAANTQHSVNPGNEGVTLGNASNRWKTYTSMLSTAIATKYASYTATTTDATILCNATFGAITITLPWPGEATGQILIIKKIDSSANAITVSVPSGSTITIDGASRQTITSRYGVIRIQSDGSNYFVL